MILHLNLQMSWYTFPIQQNMELCTSQADRINSIPFLDCVIKGCLYSKWHTDLVLLDIKYYINIYTNKIQNYALSIGSDRILAAENSSTPDLAQVKKLPKSFPTGNSISNYWSQKIYTETFTVTLLMLVKNLKQIRYLSKVEQINYVDSHTGILHSN